MAWTLCISNDAVVKAGYHADAAIVVSSPVLARWSDEVEGEMCAAARTDFVTNYSSFPTLIQKALGNAASSGIALRIAGYHPTAYTLKAVSLILNLQDNIYGDAMKILKDKENHKFN